ncbi:MAG: nucleotidyltransferase domain-containing protein [Nanoarchaeota archaeon]|nr:nucleotidyltransferase domain-containing protein [Nanoarchaeota archaeon]
MLRKRNDFEIIELLRKEQSHIRQIGADLGLIPSTVMRIMKQLEEENIVDFKQQGKNKTYFLKETPEAKTYLFITEQHKLLKTIQQPKLRRIIKELQNKTKGELIVLFGSQAKGTATKNSDIDIYIETTDKKLREKTRLISEKLSVKIGKLDKENLLTKEIIKKHIIIQNIERFYQLIK